MKRFKARQRDLLFILILSVFLITGCGGGGGGEVTGHWLPSPSVTSIAATPATASVPVTGTQQYTATATYSDGSTRDVTTSSSWISDTPANASVGLNTGIATGKVVSTSTIITATFEGKTATVTLTVNAATSKSFVVTPATASIPATVTQQYTATETFCDGSTFDRTAVSTWSAADVAPAVGVATIVATTGLATGNKAGDSTITATYAASPFSPATAILTVTTATSTKFEVAPATAEKPVSGTQQFAAIESFSDGTTIDRAKENGCAWTVADKTGGPGVAIIDNTSGSLTKGQATGKVVGTSDIIAAYGGYTGAVGLADRTAVLTVTAATSTKFEVTPATATIVVDSTQQYAATETFSDGTTLDRTTASTWSAIDVAPAVGVATISNSAPNIGQATGKVAGDSTITATYAASPFSPATATLTVTDLYPASCAGPGPVDMGAADSFGVLVGPAGGATLTITNPTTVNGDTGAASYVPAVGPSTLVGTKYTGVDAPYVAAKAAMLTAITCASDRACGVGAAFNFSGDHDFGGDTLDPGVYCVTGGMSVGSNLTLTKSGVYIFRSTGALTSSNTISVTLAGTATSSNTSIFWVPTGAASIGTDNAFLGTIMPEASAATTLGANTTLINGRAFSNSDVNLDTNTITKPTY